MAHPSSTHLKMVLQSSKTALPSWGQGFTYEPFGDMETLTALVGTHPTGRETEAHRTELLEDTAFTSACGWPSAPHSCHSG